MSILSLSLSPPLSLSSIDLISKILLFIFVTEIILYYDYTNELKIL